MKVSYLITDRYLEDKQIHFALDVDLSPECVAPHVWRPGDTVSYETGEERVLMKRTADGWSRLPYTDMFKVMAVAGACLIVSNPTLPSVFPEDR